MSGNPANAEAKSSRRKSLKARVFLPALVGGATGTLLGSFVTFVPGAYVLGGRDITWIVGIGEFALVGAVLGAVIGFLFPSLT